MNLQTQWYEQERRNQYDGKRSSRNLGMGGILLTLVLRCGRAPAQDRT